MIFYGIWDILFDNIIDENNILTNSIFHQNWDINYPNESMHMGTSSDLKFHSDGMLFTFIKCTFKTITLKKVSILYLKCLAKNTGFKLSYLDVLKKAQKSHLCYLLATLLLLTQQLLKVVHSTANQHSSML